MNCKVVALASVKSLLSSGEFHLTALSFTAALCLAKKEPDLHKFCAMMLTSLCDGRSCTRASVLNLPKAQLPSGRHLPDVSKRFLDVSG